ncbi:MAG: hypothetical protein MUF22_00020 [Chitinispirillaceae bacterium]|jgi:hypothetical protein|nr:hypothetical protein [Chitinispirillaceae bacterium]
MKRIITAVAVAVLAFGCNEKNPAGPGDTAPAGTVKFMGGTYTTSGDTITMVAKMDSCNGTTLVTYTETSKSTYRVTGDSLYVTSAEEPDPNGYKRVGTGTGLEGTWIGTFEESGIIGDAYIVISGNTVSFYLSKSLSLSMVKVIASLFATMDTSAFSVDTSFTDKVTMTGKKTSELLTVTINDDGSAVWSSSNKARATTVVDLFKTTSCASGDDPFPAWFMLFIEDNAGGAAAKRGVPVLPTIKPLI